MGTKVATKQKTRAEHLREAVAEYRRDHPGETLLDLDFVAGWLLQTRKAYPKPKSLRKQLAKELAYALREDYDTDPKGRRIRRMHAAKLKRIGEDGKEEQYTLWADIKDAPPTHMRTAFQQRRGGVLADAKQLKNDVDSYNEFNPHGAHIPMSYNLEPDLLEMDLPDEYPAGPGEGSDNPDDSPPTSPPGH